MRWRNLALAAASLLVSLGLVEILLRLAGLEFQDTFHEADLDRGWRLRHGFGGWTADENRLFVQTNSAGMRDRERSLSKPPGTLRIAIFGDSYMEAMNVPYEKCFAAALEAELRRLRGSQPVETLNFGVSGYGTAQQLLAFRHHALQYKPDLVLATVYIDNDIFNNVRQLNPSSDAAQSPYFLLESGRLALDDSFRGKLKLSPTQHWVRRLRTAATDHTYLGRFFYMFLVNWRARRNQQSLLANTRQLGVQEVSDLSAQLYRPPSHPLVTQAWQVTEALLDQFHDEARQAGAEFWIVTLSNRPQVHPDPAVREQFRRQAGAGDLFYPDLRISRFARARSIPAITLAPALAGYALQNKAFLNGGYNARVPLGSGHWNEVAHQQAARIVAARLVSDSRFFQ